MKKLKVKILSFNMVNKKIILKEVVGYHIDSIAAITRDDRGYWFVVEIESGIRICEAKTKQDALNEYQKDETKEKITKVHKTDFYKHLKNLFKEMKGQN